METKPAPSPPPVPKITRGQPANPRAADNNHASEGDVPGDLPRPGALTIISLTLLFLALMAGLFVVGWLPHHAAEVQIRADAAELDIDMPVVTVTQPTQSAASSDLLLPCDVRADQETAIFPRTSARSRAL